MSDGSNFFAGLRILHADHVEVIGVGRTLQKDLDDHVGNRRRIEQ